MAQSSKEFANQVAQITSLVREAPDVYGRSGLLLSELRKALLPKEQSSKRATATGIREHLFNLRAVRNFSDFNPHHAACINAKVATTVGLGFKSEKVFDVLNPICDFSLMDMMTNTAEDYWETGNGYLEVVTDPEDFELVTGLHHLPAAETLIVSEDREDSSLFHYEISSDDEGASSVNKKWARFGDLEDFLKRHKDVQADQVSQVIHWRKPTSRSRWYGYPEYFSAVPSIELVQAMTQNEFNFFFNNGVPEYLLFMIGKKLPKAEWDEIVKMLKSNQGIRNSHRSQAINVGVPKTDFEVQVEKFTNDADNPFVQHSEVAAVNIVTAHGVPPVIAGIQIPGKMGGNNETPNALMLFQVLKIGTAQRALSQLLASTLGRKGMRFGNEDGGEETLTAKDFLGGDEEKPTIDPVSGMPSGPMPSQIKGNGFHTVLEEINLGTMSTLAGMREPVTGSGRDLSAGKLTSSDDRAKAGGKPSRGTGAAQKRPSRRIA